MQPSLIDFTGGFFSAIQIQIKTTFNLARLVALEAAKWKVKAYVRLQHPFYECKEKGAHDEKENPKPDGVVGTWWHETMRTLGAIEGCVLACLTFCKKC